MDINFISSLIRILHGSKVFFSKDNQKISGSNKEEKKGKNSILNNWKKNFKLIFLIEEILKLSFLTRELLEIIFFNGRKFQINVFN